MQITLDMTEGQAPDVPRGQMGYFFVRARSPYDNKVRLFGAYYLNAYPLHYEYGCADCEDRGEENCPMADGGDCPTTGWFDEVTHPDFDTVYERLSGDVIAFCKPPEPADN